MAEEARSRIAQNRGLGRGLSALLGDGDPEARGQPESANRSRNLPIAFLKPNPLQPRRLFDAEEMKSLTASIAEKGVLQPILVRPTGTPWNKAAHDQSMRMLRTFDQRYRLAYRGYLPMKDDKDVTEADFTKYNVVLFGDPGSNSWIGKMNGKLPVSWPRSVAQEPINVGDPGYDPLYRFGFGLGT